MAFRICFQVDMEKTTTITNTEEDRHIIAKSYIMKIVDECVYLGQLLKFIRKLNNWLKNLA